MQLLTMAALSARASVSREFTVYSSQFKFPNLVADQTRSVRTPVLMWIPPKYLSLVIGKSLTPRQLWMEVASKVIQDGLADECRPFLDWIGFAGICHEAGADSHIARPPLAQPLSSPRLLTNPADLLLQLLPGLASPAHVPTSAPTTTTEAGIGLPLAAALTELASSFRAPVTTVAPKTCLAKWDAVHNATLLMLCGVETEEELPSMWGALANAGKGDRAVLERALHETARLCNKFNYTPSATVHLTKDIVELRFHALKDSNLDEGVQPFALTVAGSRSIASTKLKAVEAQSATYDTLMAAELAQVSLSDTEALSAMTTRTSTSGGTSVGSTVGSSLSHTTPTNLSPPSSHPQLSQLLHSSKEVPVETINGNTESKPVFIYCSPSFSW
jgi:hypothetical protein